MVTPTLHFSKDEYQQRIAKTRKAMNEKGAELIIVSDPSNMAWLTGYDGWSFYVHQAVLLGLEGEPVWFGREQDANGAKRTCFIDEANIISYADHFVQSTERHPMDELSRLIDQRGWARARIGVEMDNYYFSRRSLRHAPEAFAECGVLRRNKPRQLAACGEVRTGTCLYAKGRSLR